jgi:uncharacterized membrane protein YidH (DUF202 family)
MSGLTILLLILVAVIGSAAPVVSMWALWRGQRGEWERYTGEQRRRFLVTLAITTPLVVGGTVALILIDPFPR